MRNPVNKLTQLDQQYRAWWRSLFPDGTCPIRPISVGYYQSPTTRITPHLGRVQGGLEYTGFRGLYGKEKTGVHPSGVDGDWLANWHTTEDIVTWNIEVVEPGNYEIALNLSCPRGQEGSMVRVSVGEKYLDKKVPVAEMEIGEWQEVSWGSLRLGPGKYRLSVQAKNMVGGEVMALGSMVVRRR